MPRSMQRLALPIRSRPTVTWESNWPVWSAAAGARRQSAGSRLRRRAVGGVLGEDGFDGIRIGPDGPGRSFQIFQRALVKLKQRGVLLVLVSQNEEADVLEVFDKHPGMILRREDIAAWRVNWSPKSENLKELAQQLNLGLDSFVFIDDDPAQRLQVESRLPLMHVFPHRRNRCSMPRRCHGFGSLTPRK